MVSKYLIYMVSFLALIGMVSAGTYSQESYNGMFKTIEFKSLSAKFDKEKKVEMPLTNTYTTEKSFLMKSTMKHKTCFRAMDGCINCDSSTLTNGFGQITNYDGANSVKASCAENNEVNGFSKSAFRDDFKESSCDFERNEVNINSVKQFGNCGVYY